jgi:hypothetical protein
MNDEAQKSLSRREASQLNMLKKMPREAYKIHKQLVEKVRMESEEELKLYIEDRTEHYRIKLNNEIARFKLRQNREERKAVRLQKATSDAPRSQKYQQREVIEKKVGAYLKEFREEGIPFTLTMLEKKDNEIFRDQYRYICNALVKIKKLVLIRKGRGHGKESWYGFPGQDYSKYNLS